MDFKEKIRVIEGFPQAGISFKDITTLIKDPIAFAAAVDELAALIEWKVDLIAGPEARGFIFGTALAYKIGAGFIPVRKPGKLPGETISYVYDLEYGTDELQLHADAIEPGQSVLLVDDLLATGGSLSACAKLVEKAGGIVAGILVLIELTDLGGRERLSGYDTKAIVSYPS